MGDPYEALAAALDRLPNGFPRTPSGVELRLLARLATPEEATLAALMGREAEPFEDIAARAGLEPDAARKRLMEMAKRGLVWISKGGGKLQVPARAVRLRPLGSPGGPSRPRPRAPVRGVHARRRREGHHGSGTRHPPRAARARRGEDRADPPLRGRAGHHGRRADLPRRGLHLPQGTRHRGRPSLLLPPAQLPRLLARWRGSPCPATSTREEAIALLDEAENGRASCTLRLELQDRPVLRLQLLRVLLRDPAGRHRVRARALGGRRLLPRGRRRRMPARGAASASSAAR